jgi:hypothetical protein
MSQNQLRMRERDQPERLKDSHKKSGEKIGVEGYLYIHKAPPVHILFNFKTLYENPKL